jgi:hypothetical protein
MSYFIKAVISSLQLKYNLLPEQNQHKGVIQMKRRQTLAILLASLSILALPACASTDKPDEDSFATDSETVSDEVTQNITEDSYKAQLEYYMQTVESLQDELLASKESIYVLEAEYKLQLEKLENDIHSLTEKLQAAESGKSENSDTPVVKPPKNDHPDLDSLAGGISSKGEETETDKSDSSKSYFEYKIESGEVTIVSFIGNGESVSVPDTIGGRPVRTIGEGAFKNSRIKSIKISEGILTIDWFAFEGCTSLGRIEIPSSVTSICYAAFERCPKDLIIICKKGSYTEAYAASWGIPYIAE